jgi:hypothetical protein
MPRRLLVGMFAPKRCKHGTRMVPARRTFRFRCRLHWLYRIGAGFYSPRLVIRTGVATINNGPHAHFRLCNGGGMGLVR